MKILEAIIFKGGSTYKTPVFLDGNPVIRSFDVSSKAFLIAMGVNPVTVDDARPFKIISNRFTFGELNFAALNKQNNQGLNDILPKILSVEVESGQQLEFNLIDGNGFVIVYYENSKYDQHFISKQDFLNARKRYSPFTFTLNNLAPDKLSNLQGIYDRTYFKVVNKERRFALLGAYTKEDVPLIQISDSHNNIMLPCIVSNSIDTSPNFFWDLPTDSIPVFDFKNLEQIQVRGISNFGNIVSTPITLNFVEVMV